MAATVSSSSVWGVKSKPGAWALEAEQHEEDLQSSDPTALHPEPPSADFPTLAAAAATKTKKKKPQTLSLAEFSTYTPSAFRPSVADELLALPTGPRERSAEELERSRNGFGGGFRSYGYDSANPRARVSERGAGYDGNSTRDRADEGLSRADEADDWSKTKKFSGASGDMREKVGFFNSSRADEVDNWASKKSFAPAVTEGRRERRMGFDTFSNGADSDSWTRAKGERDNSAGGTRLAGAADSENWLKKKESNGGVVNAGRPRISLQPRTLPIINHSNGGGMEVKPSPKGSNPFGDARPREEVLKEKGKDWKEIDEKLEAFKVKDEPANPWRKNDDLMGKKSWRKEETEIAQPAVSGDKVDKGDVEDGVPENTEEGDVENN